MSEQDNEYYGLMATMWDLFRGDTSEWEDRFFYLDLIDHLIELLITQKRAG